MTRRMALDLAKQVGPLPLGAWIVVVGGGLGLAYYGYRNQSGPAIVVPDTSGDPGVGDGSTGGGWLPTNPPSNPGSVGPTVITTNEEWGVAAINWLIAQGYNPAVSDSAIRKYLAGNDPKPSIQEYTLQGLALARFGSPPQPLPPAVNNPPTSTPPPATPKPPPAAPKPPPSTKPQQFDYYVVKAWPAKGSTLSGIAEIKYKRANRWVDIYNANRKGRTRADGKPGMISNPNLIYAGWSLLIPR